MFANSIIPNCRTTGLQPKNAARVATAGHHFASRRLSCGHAPAAENRPVTIFKPPANIMPKPLVAICLMRQRVPASGAVERILTSRSDRRHGSAGARQVLRGERSPC